MSSNTLQRKPWLATLYFFSVTISFLLFLSYLRYPPAFSQQFGSTTLETALAWLFTFFSFLTQAIILNTLWLGIIALLRLCRIPNQLLLVLAILLSTLLNVMIICDTVTYGLYRAHELDTAITIFTTNALGEVMPMSWKELGAFIIAGILMLGFECAGLWLLCRYKPKLKQLPGRKAFLLIVGTVCLITYTTLTIATDKSALYRHLPTMDHLLLRGADQVPYYSKLYRFLVPIVHANDHDLGDEQAGDDLIVRGEAHRVNYPLHPVHYAKQKSLPNILFLYIDTWRYDAMNASATPNIYHFAQEQQQFSNYWSAGNCTKTGVFSLFYGLPAVYWEAMASQARGPVLLQAIQQHDYQMGLFASATLRFPAFDTTVFVNNQDKLHRTTGELTVDRDKQITIDFLSFLKKRDPSKPFFSFVFYDSVHNYCGGGPNRMQTPFKPAIQNCSRFLLTNSSDPTPYHNRYLNAAHFVDQEAGKILAALKKQGLLDNTIIVISADHGEEMNDSHLGYWSHASAYDQYQIHIPMIVHWPGMPAQTVSHFTTSLDVVPTLMQRVFHTKNAKHDYTVGEDLWQKGKRPFFIAGSYTDYAILDPKRIVRISPNGDYTINDRGGFLQKDAALPRRLVHRANEQLTRYLS